MEGIRHITLFASWYPAGAQSLNGNFIRDFARALSSRYRVSVIYVGADPQLRLSEVSVSRRFQCTEYVASLPYRKGLFGFLRYQMLWWRQIGQFWRQMCAEEGKPDLIQLQVVWKMGLAAVWYAWRKKIPFIVQEHWTGYYPTDPQLKGLRVLWHRLILRRAKGVSAVSKPLAVALEAWGARKPVSVLMNVVHEPEAHVPRSYQPHFLHVSNFREEHKQSRTVAMVFQKLREEYPEARMTMTGNVPDDFRREMKHIPGLEFTGVCSRKEMSRLYSHASAVVSFSRFETFALSIAEGLQHGTPAIYTACGGPETYMQPHWGLRADANDPDTLYRCMRSFCEGNQIWNHDMLAAEAQHLFNQNSLLDAFDRYVKNLV